MDSSSLLIVLPLLEEIMETAVNSSLTSMVTTTPRLPALRGIMKTSPNRPSTQDVFRAKLSSDYHPMSMRACTTYNKYIVVPPLYKKYICFRCESQRISDSIWRLILSAELRPTPPGSEIFDITNKQFLTSYPSRSLKMRTIVKDVSVVPASSEVANEATLTVIEDNNDENLVFDLTVPPLMISTMKSFGDSDLALEILPKYDNISDDDTICQLSEEIAIFSDTFYLRQPKQVLGSVCDYISSLGARERDYIFTDPVLSRAFAENRRVVSGKNIWQLIRHNFTPLNQIPKRIYFKLKSSVTWDKLEVTEDSNGLICPKKWKANDVSSVYRQRTTLTRLGSLKRTQFMEDVESEDNEEEVEQLVDVEIVNRKKKTFLSPPMTLQSPLSRKRKGEMQFKPRKLIK